MKARMRTEAAEMETKHRQRLDASTELESLSDDDLEALLFNEEETRQKGFLNLPTLAGMGMIFVGIVYLLQHFNLWSGFDVSGLVSTLPWLAGILIILIGFGVLSWRPRKARRKVKKGINLASGDPVRVETKPVSDKKKKRLVRSRNKQLMGVCGGIAEYFNIDPTLVRIAFVIATIAAQGSGILAYLVLAWVMPKPEAVSAEERITILRDY